MWFAAVYKNKKDELINSTNCKMLDIPGSEKFPCALPLNFSFALHSYVESTLSKFSSGVICAPK